MEWVIAEWGGEGLGGVRPGPYCPCTQFYFYATTQITQDRNSTFLSAKIFNIFDQSDFKLTIPNHCCPTCPFFSVLGIWPRLLLLACDITTETGVQLSPPK